MGLSLLACVVDDVRLYPWTARHCWMIRWSLEANLFGDKSKVTGELLMLDAGLYGFGIKWLPYPANVMVIAAVCMAIYLVRLVAHGSHAPSGGKGAKPLAQTIATAALAIVLAVILAFAAGRTHLAQVATGNQGDSSAVIMMVVSGVGLLISAIVAIVKKACEGKGE